MRLLDLFCGAGGAAVGYHRAGFDEIVGVDNRPMPRYPFTVVLGDALEYVAAHGHEFDAIHASPPCQGYSCARNNGSGRDAPKLLEAVRRAMPPRRPYVIENVQGSRRQMLSPALLCGSAFGLGMAGMDLPRHRLFETNWLLLVPACSHRRGQTLGVYGNGTNQWHRDLLGRNLRAGEAAEGLGIDWMRRHELSQAIPPVYTEYIGAMLLAWIEHVRSQGASKDSMVAASAKSTTSNGASVDSTPRPSRTIKRVNARFKVAMLSTSGAGGAEHTTNDGIDAEQQRGLFDRPDASSITTAISTVGSSANNGVNTDS